MACCIIGPLHKRERRVGTMSERGDHQTPRLGLSLGGGGSPLCVQRKRDGCSNGFAMAGPTRTCAQKGWLNARRWARGTAMQVAPGPIWPSSAGSAQGLKERTTPKDRASGLGHQRPHASELLRAALARIAAYVFGKNGGQAACWVARTADNLSGSTPDVADTLCNEGPNTRRRLHWRKRWAKTRGCCGAQPGGTHLSLGLLIHARIVCRMQLRGLRIQALVFLERAW